MPNAIHSSKSNIISFSDIKAIVNRAFKDHPKIIDFNLISYSSETVGFLGEHMNLEIVIKRSNSSGTEKHSFFAKVVPFEIELQSAVVKDCGFFNQEANFYNKIVPLIDKYMSEPWVPKCYLANENVIILEDVRQKGFKMVDTVIFEGENLKAAMRALARMHACSIIAEKELKRPLNEVFPEACREKIFCDEMKAAGMIDPLIALAEKIAQEHGRHYKGLASAFDEVCRQVKNCNGKYRVISHGDTRSNNYMLHPNGQCMIVDFQLARYGFRTWDVAQLIHYSTTKQIRGDQETDMLKVYHEEFNRTIGKYDSCAELPSWRDTLNQYENARLLALFATMFYYPFLLLKKEEYQQHKDNPEAMYAKYIMRKDNDGVLDLMERDEEYGRRMTEATLELIELCEKLYPDM